MKHLLDTHVLLRLLTAPERLPETVRGLLADPVNPLLVSAAAALEISAKIRIGKLEARTLLATLPRRVADIGATALPVSMDHALLAGLCVGSTATRSTGFLSLKRRSRAPPW